MDQPPDEAVYSPEFASRRGRELRNARQELSLSQAAVARLSGFSEETVRKAEAGQAVRPSTYKEIRDALKRAKAGDVSPPGQDHSDVLLDLPDEALAGLSEVEREEVRTAARLAALEKARQIRGGNWTTAS